MIVSTDAPSINGVIIVVGTVVNTILLYLQRNKTAVVSDKVDRAVEQTNGGLTARMETAAKNVLVAELPALLKTALQDYHATNPADVPTTEVK